VVLLDWYISVFGGVSFVYMCGFVVDWVRLCFWVSVLACVYMSSLSLFVGFVLFCVSCVCDFVFVCVCGSSDSLAPNKDIMRFRCGGGDATLQSFENKKERKFFKKTKKILYFRLVSGSLVLFWMTLIHCTLAISLYISKLFMKPCPKCVILGPNSNPNSSL